MRGATNLLLDEPGDHERRLQRSGGGARDRSQPAATAASRPGRPATTATRSTPARARNGSRAACGDGTARTDLEAGAEGYEGCDDGNATDNDGCTNACAIAQCGDGILRSDVSEGELGFEACDDGNGSDEDGCLSDCTEALRGRGCPR